MSAARVYALSRSASIADVAEASDNTCVPVLGALFASQPNDSQKNHSLQLPTFRTVHSPAQQVNPTPTSSLPSSSETSQNPAQQFQSSNESTNSSEDSSRPQADSTLVNAQDGARVNEGEEQASSEGGEIDVQRAIFNDIPEQSKSVRTVDDNDSVTNSVNLKNSGDNSVPGESLDRNKAINPQKTIPDVSNATEEEHDPLKDVEASVGGENLEEVSQKSRPDPAVSSASTSNDADMTVDRRNSPLPSSRDEAANHDVAPEVNSLDPAVPSTTESTVNARPDQSTQDVERVAQNPVVQSAQPKRLSRRGLDWVFDLGNPNPLGSEF